MKASSLLASILNETKISLRLAFPLIITEVIYSMNGFLGTIMVARLGKEELAASALAGNIYIALTLFFMGILCSTSILVSQSFGAKDNKGISICFKQGIIMAILFTPFLMFLIWISPIVLIWTGQNPNIVNLAKPLFHAWAWSVLPLNLMIVTEQFLVGINRTKLVLVMSILTMPLTVAFYYVFMFGKFGFPKLGLSGMGYGLLVAYFLVALFFICYLYFAKSLRVYHLFTKWWQINKKFLFEMINIGLPLGFVFGIEVAFFATIAIMMGLLGTTTLAAYQITYQYLMIAIVVIFGLNQVVTIRIGYEVGRNDRGALKLAARVNFVIGFIFMLFFSIFFISFPEEAISLIIDINTPNFAGVVKEAIVFLSVVALLILTDSFRLLSLASLRGLKDTKFPLFGSIIGFWLIGFSSAYLFGFKLHFGGVGIWWGTVLGLFTAGLMLFIRFNYLANRIDLKALVTKN